ncbi:MAG TPA: hypothetical protein VG755_34285 [Nannocystaceae bacterium]|nr:hypothetical protein [Nannocystaceae bacterium]
MRTRAWIFALTIACACDKGGDAAKTEASKSDPKAAATSDAKGTPTAAGDEGGGDHLPEAGALLEQAVAAVGGREKIDAVKSWYVEGELSVSGQNITGGMKLWWKEGDFYTEQTMVGIGTIRGGKQGEVIWSEDPINGLRKLSGAEAEQYSWGSSLLLAADWQRYFASANTITARELDGKQVYDVELTSKSGAKVTLTFDAKDGLQVAQAFKGSTPLGEMPIAVKLQDYREVDGLKLPFRQVTDAKLAEATQQITKMELNGPVDAAKFAMPTGGAEVVKPGPPQPDQPLGTQ